jgi:integrase
MISESDIFPEDHLLIQKLYQVNPELKDTYKIKRILSPLNEKQRAKILEIAEKQNYKHYLMIRMMLETGIRVNELTNLVIDQINFDAGVIIIQSHDATKYYKSFKTKTQSSNREISLPKNLAKLIKSNLGPRKSGYVFESQKKSRYTKNSVITMINSYARKCDSIPQRTNSKGNLTKDIGSHALRRTYASYLLQNNVPISEISKLLGHSSIRTTMLYLFEIQPVDHDKIRKIVDKMNN